MFTRQSAPTLVHAHSLHHVSTRDVHGMMGFPWEWEYDQSWDWNGNDALEWELRRVSGKKLSDFDVFLRMVRDVKFHMLGYTLLFFTLFVSHWSF